MNVFMLMHASDLDLVAAARRELRRRGFNSLQIDLGQRATHDNPQVRLELIDRLPEILGLDAKPWLLWLLEDKDGDVRYAAMATLATTDDPDIKRQIRAKAGADSDPRVAELIRKLR